MVSVTKLGRVTLIKDRLRDKAISKGFRVYYGKDTAGYW